MVDVLLHVLGAFVFCFSMVWMTTPWFYMAIANAAFWIGREWAQHLNETPFFDWSTGVWLEAFVPAVAGFVFSYAAHRAFKD